MMSDETMSEDFWAVCVDSLVDGPLLHVLGSRRRRIEEEQNSHS